MVRVVQEGRVRAAHRGPGGHLAGAAAGARAASHQGQEPPGTAHRTQM